jgi:spermidine/putrescine transport system ATP-binding protein
VANPRDIYNNPVNGFVASFVGENNVLTGETKDVSGGMANFVSPIGTFRARLGTAEKQSGLKLYVRPEHTVISQKPGAENSVPVTIEDVSFEGSFIAIQGRTDKGTLMTAEVPNDGKATVPDIGAKLHMSFAANLASILPDSMNLRA